MSEEYNTRQIVKMFSFWKKHNDDNTPRRAILEFINKATPKESPAAEETISADKVILHYKVVALSLQSTSCIL